MTASHPRKKHLLNTKGTAEPNEKPARKLKGHKFSR